MEVSFFETGRYLAPETGARAYRGMIERLRYVEELGFDWISLSEHHYSPRILTPSPMVAAANLAAHVRRIKFALLGPIVPQSNPLRRLSPGQRPGNYRNIRPSGGRPISICPTVSK